jgi:hypothetical protein
VESTEVVYSVLCEPGTFWVFLHGTQPEDIHTEFLEIALLEGVKNPQKVTALIVRGPRDVFDGEQRLRLVKITVAEAIEKDGVDESFFPDEGLFFNPKREPVWAAHEGLSLSVLGFEVE